MYNTIDQIASFLDNQPSSGIKPGLERVLTLLEAVGHPQKMSHAIHIAGTNGKGSTTAFISRALQQNGYQVGVFASPSFHGLNGHIMIDDSIMPADEFVEAFNQLESTIHNQIKAGDPPTSFEIVTVIAFMYFARHAEIALIEAGMGGRHDATNVFEPILSIITNVSYDHTVYLGSTIESIASHKAGIIKSHTPVIVGELNEEAKYVIDAEAKQKQADVYQLGSTFTYTFDDTEKEGAHYLYKSRELSFDVSLRLRGEHQIKNSAIAVMALVLMHRNQFTLDRQKVLEGLSKTCLPGRYEEIHQSPSIIVDGAHNPAGISTFLQTVETDLKSTQKILLFAAFKDKDLEAMLDMASKVFDIILLTTFDHPRAASQTDYERLCLNKGVLSFEPSWQNVLINILEEGEHKHTYYVAGSLHFIERVRQYVIQKA